MSRTYPHTKSKSLSKAHNKSKTTSKAKAANRNKNQAKQTTIVNVYPQCFPYFFL